MFRFGMGELTIILLIVLLLFGGKKLPEIAKAIGRSVREFKKAGKDIREGVNGTDDEEKEGS